MEEDEKLTGQHATLVKTLDEKFTGRMQALETVAEEQGATLLKVQEGIESMQEQLREKRKSRSHHGISYVEGAEDAFDKDNHNPDTRFNLARAMCGHHMQWDYDKTPFRDMKGDQSLWPERDIIMAATQKAQSAGVDIDGGFAVPEQFHDEYIPFLFAKAVTAQLGITVMDGLVGSPQVWPRIDSKNAASWVGENVEATETKITMGQITMTPKDLVAPIPVSNRLMKQTAGKFERALMNVMSRSHALALDIAVLKGTGASAQPRGVFNTSGISTADWNSVTKSGASQDVTDILAEMEDNVDSANALEGSLGYVGHPKVHKWFRGVKDADGHPILAFGDPNNPGPRNLNGYKFEKTTQLADGDPADFIFGDWSSVWLGMWGTLQIDTSREAGQAFFRRQTWFQATLTADVAVEHVESFCIAQNFDSTS